jgi:hypothetical protein
MDSKGFATADDAQKKKILEQMEPIKTQAVDLQERLRKIKR